jgi:Flp pilus assembly protein TadD
MIPTRKHLDYALGYLQLNLVEEARKELTRIPRDERHQPDVQAVHVELAMAENNWERVVALAAPLTEIIPTIERPWIAWAYALRELQRVEEAREVLLKAESLLEKATVLVDYNLACYYCVLGDLREARRRLARVFKREPDWRGEASTDPDLAALRSTLP